LCFSGDKLIIVNMTAGVKKEGFVSEGDTGKVQNPIVIELLFYAWAS
jgi:hypothetical protein